MSLPILTAPEDVLSIVDYLRSKPAGATIAEAKAALLQPTLDARKLSAYQSWDIVVREDGRLKLTARGWELARKQKTAEQIFRETIDGLAPYRSAVEWIYYQKFESVTNVDIASHWHEHHKNATGAAGEDALKDQAVCFMRVCAAAGLGQFTLGRRGQPTRFTVDRPALKLYIEAGPSVPPWTEPEAEVQRDTSEEGEPDATDNDVEATPSVEPPVQVKKLRVFISHGQNVAIAEQVETMLGLADIEAEVATKEETAAIPVPEKVFSAMRRCQAGIIIVSAEENTKAGENQYRINENVLIEVGAAFVLYDKRVVLLWDKRLPVPSNLQGLYRCEYEGDDLNWGAGMKLMKAIKEFRKS
jgi:hypothetical protein